MSAGGPNFPEQVTGEVPGMAPEVGIAEEELQMLHVAGELPVVVRAALQDDRSPRLPRLQPE